MSDFTCQYCGKTYRKESTLMAHMCEKKRRYAQEKEIGVQNGYRAYKRFYELNQPNTNRTYKDFVDSQYYIAFVKFGRHIKMINALKPDKFIDFVIKKQKKLDHWCRDSIYEEYLIDVLQRENPNDTFSRAFETMIEWGDEEDAEWNHYFKYANRNLVCEMIKRGCISPWIVYNSDTGMDFLTDLNEDQLGYIYDRINPEYWQSKFKNYMADAEYVKQTLKEAGL